MESQKNLNAIDPSQSEEPRISDNFAKLPLAPGRSQVIEISGRESSRFFA
jgi:hypothetical protein